MKIHSVRPLVLVSAMALGLLHGCAGDPANLAPTAENKTQASDNKAFTYGSPKAENFPAGTRDWWEAMVREGRTGISKN